MVKTLPKWNGEVVGAMHRMGMTVNALSVEMGVTRTYVSKLLNTPRHTEQTRSRVENAMRSFAEEIGINFEDVWPAKEQPERRENEYPGCPLD